MSFTVQDKHTISLITTAATLTRTRNKLRGIATIRPAAYPSTRALLQLHIVQQRAGKILRRSACDVMNLSDCTGCSSRQSFPLCLSAPFADFYSTCFSSRLSSQRVRLQLTNQTAAKLRRFPNFDDTWEKYLAYGFQKLGT